jgi:hypothetical protein
MPVTMLNKKRTSNLILFFIIIFSMSIAITGCGDYKQVTITKKGIRCSFEYPSSYIDIYYSLNSENDFSFLVRYPPDNQNKGDREITISFFIPNEDYPDAKSFLNEFLENMKSIEGEEFQLIKRSSITVSGIECEIVVHSGNYHFAYLNSAHAKCWEIYLDYRGYMWILGLDSNIDITEGAEEEFQHLINSFRFLD